MGVKEIVAYICFAAAAVSFVTMWLIPKIRRQREASQRIRENQLQGAKEATED